MKRWRIAGAVAGVAAASAFMKARGWRGDTVRAVTELEATAFSMPPPEFGCVDLDAFEALDLPGPVRRYFRFALSDGQPVVRVAHVAQAGSFRLGGRWCPFRAVEVFTAAPVAFVWDAAIRVAPALRVLVRDSYVGGRGCTEASLGGAFRIADAPAGPQLDESALYRYLAEAVLFPTALLPSSSLVWTAGDDSHATVTLHDAGSVAAIEFTFDASGAIVEAFAAQRYREQRGVYRASAWGATYAAYVERGGVRVPTSAEVFWAADGRREPYFRGTFDPRYQT